MKLLIPLMAVLATSCSDGWATGQADQNGRTKQTAPMTRPAIALTGRVTDEAGIIDATRAALLSNRLAELERTTGHQLVIVTVKTLGGKDVATFTRDLGNAWKIGRAKYKDGVILLVAPNEQNVRIEVGYGLEKTLPNALCNQIIKNQIIPHFRNYDLPGGIEAGANALIDKLS